MFEQNIYLTSFNNINLYSEHIIIFMTFQLTLLYIYIYLYINEFIYELQLEEMITIKGLK